MVLARQFRPCPQRVLHELPGGSVEPAVGPAGTAAAGLLEETGYQGSVRPVTEVRDDACSDAIRTRPPPPTASRSPNRGPSGASSPTRS
ncbi:NUDIX domain-containing protein [Kitasatospora sp. SolWspMP-SS2h]|uniref:NUDIX domain-containing protein n=1 Tax=Kitasatospora sp. SolWspMP-SS2h TaxID=1305729 RepID=UPI000DB90B33|nr:NUDIX domain-containing protein [Kitasatospora sp. SolWspMP-SS2h]